MTVKALHDHETGYTTMYNINININLNYLHISHFYLETGTYQGLLMLGETQIPCDINRVVQLADEPCKQAGSNCQI